MATEELRLEASVVDRFSTPLNKLRTALSAVKPPQAVVSTTKDFEKFHAAVTRSTQALQGGYSQAITGLGVQSVFAAGAIAGLTASISRFVSNTGELKALSRETGITIQTFRNLKAVAEQFQASPEAVEKGLRQFGSNLYDFRRGLGETYAEILKVAPDMARKLREASPDKAVDIVLGELARDKDRQRAGRISELLFGTRDFERITGLGKDKLRSALAEAQKRIGVTTPEDEKRTLAFEQAIGRLRQTFEGLGQTLGTEFAPPMTKALEMIDKLIQDSKGEFGKSMIDGIRTLGETLKSFNWSAMGEAFGVVGSSLREIVSLLGIMGKLSSGDTAGAWKEFKDMGARSAAPSAIKAAREEVEARKKTLAEFDKSNPGDARRRWHEENLRTSEEKLKKAIEEGAKLGIKDGLESALQKSSYMNSAGGAQIWNASLGGNGGLGGNPGLGAGSGYGGAGRRAAMGLGAALRGGGNPAGGTANAAVRSDMMGWAMDELRKLGVPEANLRAAGAHLVGQADAESGLRPGISHDGGTGYGIYGARLRRRTMMLAWLRANNFAHDSAEGQMRYMAREAMGGDYPKTRRLLMGATPERLRADQWTITSEFEGPKVTNDRSGAVAKAYRAGVAASAGRLPNGGYWATDSRGNPVAVGADGQAVQSRKGGAFNAARESGVFGSLAPVSPTGRAELEVTINGLPHGWKSRADGGDLFRDVKVGRGRSMMQAPDEP